MKKALLIGSMLLSVLVTGCSTRPDAKNVATKATNASKDIKSITTNLTTVSEASGNKSTTKVNGQFTSKPAVYHYSQKIKGQKTGQLYVEGDTVYANTATKWYKSSGASSKKTAASVKQQLSASQASRVLNTLKDNVKLQTKGSNYILSYSGKGKTADKAVKSILKRGMASSYPAASINSLLKSVKTNNFNYKYIINKKTFLPVKSVIGMKYTMSAYKQTTTQTITGSYSDVNKTKTFHVPSTIKSHASVYKAK
ncbi:hypothetical protein LASUN_22750 [Lentilactobacillus sunkii]|jgi:hypothetical protein|uniref:Lipoprotein n=1 Tax=Lentilactobacillus sunkii TaxID=481719 RepID=A0A1E7X9I0_9LACO|nr:DUF6612 family protein [Lentilactobacillus sunkii]OFA09793.1 hypothetical protein LASUN_22750 [Lentilactobacillus sunkii]